MTRPTTARNWWDNEAHADERYATLAWGGDGTPETVQPTIAAIMENLHKFCPPAGNVMEIGCGPGRLLHRLARAYPDTTFIGRDISVGMLALGDRDRPPNVVTSLHDPEGSFGIFDPKMDFIYSVEVFQHIAADTKREYLEAIYNNLTPTGVGLIQYVEGDDEDGWVNHPECETNMKLWARMAGLKVKRTQVPNRVHDEWRWMVVSR